MSAGLPPAYRKWLDEFDSREELWANVDDEDVRGRVKDVLDRYPMPALSLARFFMEQIAALSSLLGSAETVAELEREVRGLISNQGVIASALSRRGRGRQEV